MASRETQTFFNIGEGIGRWLTSRMSHEEERVNRARTWEKPERAPPHWLDPLVGPPKAHKLYRLSLSTTLSSLKSDSHFMKLTVLMTEPNPSPMAAPTAPNVGWRAPLDLGSALS